MRYNETEAYIPPLQTLTAWRRDLHRHPELALDLPWTSTCIKEILKQTGAEILEPMDSAVAAWFDFGAPDTLMFRADMDALPVQEQTGVPWCSQTPGCMHACGHDVHMTVLLGFAMVLSRMKESPFNILLVFQPGEENPGGARLICESGLLERFGVRAAFGLHVWPALPAGTIATRPGPMMAASSEVDITIQGQSTHAAKYRQGKDALEAAVQLVAGLYSQEAALPPEIFRLLRFGRLESGTIRNVVADSALVQGTVRAFEPDRFQGLKDMILESARRQEEAGGCQVQVHFSDGYPAVINHRPLTAALMEALPDVMELEQPEMISEDFSFYQQRVPSVFFFLGTSTGIPLHDARFDVPDQVLTEGVRFWTRVLDALCRKGSGFTEEL